MKVLAIIPARGGSKGIPKKNIRLLNGKPLIFYTIDSAISSKYIDTIVVNSDSEEILNLVSQNKKIDILKRPNYLATDDSPTFDSILYTLDYYRSKQKYFDSVLILQTTFPFRDFLLIDLAIEKFYNTKADSLISVIEVPHHFNPHWVFEEDENNNLFISTKETKLISRRQELPKSFIRDGAIYITKVDVIYKKLSLYGEKVSYILNNSEYYVNIDTENDWLIAEKIIREKGIWIKS